MTQATDRKYFELQFKQIHDTLDRINIQTTKTNSRVSKLEEDVSQIEKDLLTHPINCSSAQRVEKIERDLEEYRMLKKYPKIAIGIIIIATMLTWLGYRKMIQRQDTIITKQDSFGVPVITRNGKIVAVEDSTEIRFFPNDTIWYMIVKKDKQ